MLRTLNFILARLDARADARLAEYKAAKKQGSDERRRHIARQYNRIQAWRLQLAATTVIVARAGR